jgi:hypothetical protein
MNYFLVDGNDVAFDCKLLALVLRLVVSHLGRKVGVSIAADCRLEHAREQERSELLSGQGC